MAIDVEKGRGDDDIITGKTRPDSGRVIFEDGIDLMKKDFLHLPALQSRRYCRNGGQRHCRGTSEEVAVAKGVCNLTCD